MIGLNAEFLSMQKIKDSKNIVKRQNGPNKVMAFKSYHRLIKVPIQNLKFILKASTKLQSQNPDQTAASKCRPNFSFKFLTKQGHLLDEDEIGKRNPLKYPVRF